MTNEELATRIDLLEKQVIEIGDLPIAALQRKLEKTWQPNASALLEPGSVTDELLAATVIYTPPLVSGWAIQPGAATTRAAKIKGVVTVNGFLTAAAATANHCFSLPDGWRPVGSVLVPCIYYNGAGWSAGTFVVNAGGVAGACGLYNAANSLAAETNYGFTATFTI